MNGTEENITLGSSSSSNKGIPPLLIAFTSLQMLVFVVACTGNGIVAAVFVRHIKPISTTTKFILCLAVADFFVGMSSGSQILCLFFPNLSKNMYTCLLRYQCVFMMTIASQLAAAFTTLDRYIAICHNEYHNQIMKPSVVNSIFVFLWIFSFAVAGLPFIYFNNWDDGVGCRFEYLLHDWIYLLSCTIKYSCMIVAVFLYGLILNTARKVYAKSLKRASEGHDNERNRKIMKNIRLAKVMGYVTLALVLSWSPFQVYQIRYGLGLTSDFTFNLSNWLVFLGVFNSVMNPFIYAYQRKDFRKGCQKLFGCYRNEGS